MACPVSILYLGVGAGRCRWCSAHPSDTGQSRRLCQCSRASTRPLSRTCASHRVLF
ncbi:uncharacterized protein COLE_03515 [Cutaneotrichosporon oleaginosum]|uniref:uncharacterized protein n=1 Tax=Cutaneotrichosporon oleaginosum TaxID=879819 RepID=UPI00132057EC|nr:hypothetical protein COLE_03515 [Cutaneotrichosporon oleaginosum]